MAKNIFIISGILLGVGGYFLYRKVKKGKSYADMQTKNQIKSSGEAPYKTSPFATPPFFEV